jgi:hypothetical protein
MAAIAIGLFAISTSTASAQTSGTWTNTGSLNTPRTGHTATLLPNGDVLVAGGKDATGDLASAELYTPATGMWTSAGSMSTPRIGHSATLLGNGDVLVAGGNNGAGLLPSAELYNPGTGQWKTTGSMSVPRASHGATLLLNGQVLVAAGDNNGTSDKTAELYDPSKGTWHGTGTMQSDHSFSLTLLQDGRALAVDDSGTVNSLSELYDPSSGQWSLTGPLYYAHNGSIAALGNGEALAYGNHFACYAAQIYNPTANTWSRTIGQCGTGISFGPLALLATGKVLLAGGSIVYSGKANVVSNADLYDPTTNGWLSTGRLNQARQNHTLTRLSNGQVLAAGGSFMEPTGPITYLTSAELYTP